MQQRSQAYFEVAWIGTQRLFCRSLAETAGLEIAQKLLVQVGSEALQPAADGGFVDLHDACDLEQCLLVEEVGGKQEAVLGGKRFKGARDCMGEPVEFGQALFKVDTRK